MPAGARSRRRSERLASLKDIWATLLLFMFVIGGMYAGLFTATEAAAIGAVGAWRMASGAARTA
jgi:C4-dicarboxylate transporter DctM subunit